MKSAKLYFTKDAFYNNLSIPLYDAGKVYQVDEVVPGYIERWLVRGAIEVTKGSEHDKLPLSIPNDQSGAKEKRPTPVGSKDNPVEESPVDTAPKDDGPKDEEQSEEPKEEPKKQKGK